MITDARQIIEKLPDYEDLMEVAEKIKSVSLLKSRIDVQLRSAEAEVVKIVTTDPKYFQGGKAPSMAYIDTVFKYTGLSGELVEQRKILAELTAEIELLKAKMDIYKTALDIWRTLSANERKSVI
jgi:hypothetical protein